MVANIDPTVPSIPNMGSNPAFFCTYNNEVYFSAYRTVDGRELWKTDGTANGTVLVKDIAAGDGAPSGLIVHNGMLYFSAYHPNDNYTLYKSNGTTAGTTVVKAPAAGGPTTNSDAKFHIFKGKLFFDATSNDGFYRIWYSDGSAAGTASLPSSPVVFTDYPSSLLATTNYLYFLSGDSNNPGVYRTTEVPNQMARLTDVSFTANVFQPIFLVNNCLVVRGDNGTTGDELYTVCNQNTEPLAIHEAIPFTEHVTIQLDNNNIAVEKVSLTSLEGKTISCEFLEADSSSIQLSGLDRLSSGIYFMTIQMKNNQVYQLKLTKE
jgi:ELWxxDGT repeat protein